MEEKPADRPQEGTTVGKAGSNKKPKVKPKKSVFRKIVNVFLYTFIGITVLIAILLAFTQTTTFREILRKQVIKEVNKTINAKLNIGKIDGTIFTSLIIRDASIVADQQDTLFSAGRVLLKTSPLQLLLKRIYVRNFELADARINLLKDSAGVYNFSKLSKAKEEIDTAKSKFPFQIIVADFRLNNISFRHGFYKNRNIDSSYNALNMDNLRVDSLHLALDAFANIDRNDYQLRISGANAKLNLQNFRLRDFRGNFFVTENNAKVDYLVIRTNTTDLDLYAHLDKVNLFDEFDVAKLKDSPVRVDLNVRVFDFADLQHFAVSTDMLKGTVKTKFLASGTFGNIKIERLGLDYLQTHLNAVGFVRNLHSPEDLAFKVQIVNSYINEPDIAKLLPKYTIPVYPKLQVKNINIDYEGTPLTFKTTLRADLPEGSIEGRGTMDLVPEEIKYDFELKTSKLNIEPVVPDVRTFLNAVANIRGQGFDPNILTANTTIALSSSRINEYHIDSLRLNAVADRGRIVARLNTNAMGTRAGLDANLDLRDAENPGYNLSAQVSNLDLERLLRDTSLSSNLNFALNLKGKSFDFRDMESQLDLVMNESRFQNKKIVPTNLRLTYTKPAADERLIKLNSDFADINLRGNFSIDNAAAIIGYESKIISQSILQKVYEFNPLALFNDSLQAKEFEMQVQLDKTKIPKIIDEEMNITYDLTIKDFKLISTFTGISRIDMDGAFGGTITNDTSGFRASSDINMKYLKLYTDNNLVYVSNLGFNFDVSRSNNEVDFGNIAANLRLATDRVYSGSDLKNILVQINLKNNVLDFNVASDMDTTLRAQLAGYADMTRNQFEFAINKFFVDYKGIQWVNDSALAGLYSKDEFEITKFSLLRNGSRINMAGKILGTGMLSDLRLQVQNLNAEMLKTIAESDADVNGIINLTAKADGWMDNPVINVDLDVSNVTAGKTELGNLQCNLDYADRLLKANVEFLDPALNKLKPLLTLAGSVPVDLGIIGVKERMVVGEPLTVSLKSENFNLTTIADLVPQVVDLKGILTADLNISGTSEKLSYGGKLGLSNTSFTAKQNGLPYSVDLAVSLADEAVTIDNIAIHNAGGTDHKGTLAGSGKINFEGTELKTIDLTMGGDLALLSPRAKGGDLPVTGSLVIQSNGDWTFTYDEGESRFDGAVLLKSTNITIVPPQTSYATQNNDIIYNYMVDSSQIDKKQEEFNQVLDYTRRSALLTRTKTPQETNFDYELTLTIEKEDPATVVFVISPEVSMQLTAILDGEIIYNSSGVAQGQFNLQEGSNLTFIKTLNAEGKIQFESDITDPRLDIVATYRGEHAATARSTSAETGNGSSGDTEPVEVRLPLKGSVAELGQNLASSSQNFEIYVGEDAIKNDRQSQQYGAADAMSFIMSGKFTTELTAQDKTEQAGRLADYTDPIISSVVSGLANAYLGDAVQDVEIEQQKDGLTRVGISGKIESVRYSIGGTNETLQDVSKANIRFEFPFGDNFWLRFERKDQIIETSGLNEKMNELGLRYKFIF